MCNKNEIASQRKYQLLLPMDLDQMNQTTK